MQIHLRHLDGMRFEGTNEQGHRVVFDGSPAIGGEDAGPRPMQMVLMALAACSGIDVVMILRKQRQAFEGLEVTVSAERAEEPPRVFTAVHLSFVARGEVDSRRLERAVSLSVDKYCSVAAMLRSTAEISHESRVD